MRLRELRVRGYRRLQDLTIDLDHDRVVVVGPNEAGKSTLLEALLTGLYGLQPERQGSGHAGGLRRVTPWGRDHAGLALRFSLDDGTELEVDWDFTAERTQVIDHTTGADITSRFTTGTHGWIDLGHELLGLPHAVFVQLTCVGEGELASIKDDAAVRGALRRLTDSGVDVFVEEAIDRLEEGARQAAIPRANSATRRNQLSRDLTVSQGELAAAHQARAALDHEVDTVRAAEHELDLLTRRLQALRAEDERRKAVRDRMEARLDRARGALAEAELRMNALETPAVKKNVAGWGDTEVDAARALLVAGPSARARRRVSTIFGVVLILLALAAVVYGILTTLLPAVGAGAVVLAAGVYMVTRTGVVGPENLRVGGQAFSNRAALMAAMDYERARRDHAQQAEGLQQLEEEYARFDTRPPSTPVEIRGPGHDELLARMPRAEFEALLQAKAAEHEALALRLEGMRAALERGTRDLPEIAPLEERVADLEDRIQRLSEFGDACRLAAETLAKAGEEMRRAYAPRLKEYLSRDISRVTTGRYSEALVSERFEVLLRAPETGSMVDLARLSRGTQQQVYLLLRLGLLEVMGSNAERLPLFLDDALALSDDGRRIELLDVLEGERRQVIYFTAGEGAADALFGNAWHRVRLAPPPRAETVTQVGPLTVLESSS